MAIFSRQQFYPYTIKCRKCKTWVEEDLWYTATSTGRKVRCKKCNYILRFDETTFMDKKKQGQIDKYLIFKR